MNYDIFQNINKIIERDSKATTYKFALLRGVIDLIQDNSPFISLSSDRVHFPIGLLIEKWVLYYYPILESSNFIPQIYGDANLAFEAQFRKIISAYTLHGGFSAFYNDLRNKGIPKHIQSDFLKLTKKLQETITRMPMRYIGRSISKDYYSIFQFETFKNLPESEYVDIEYLILNFGTFSIPREYYEAFKIFGSFINGKDSILFKWADFSVNASGNMLSVENVVNEVLKSPITEREVREAKELYKGILKKEGRVFCVWTGKIISQYDVDHMIPFSVWKNNDLWNLLPSNSSINQKKSDKIPSTELIEKRKDMIIHYWEILKEHQLNRFQKEIQLGLLGNLPFSSYQKSAILQLQKNCDYLITNRGYEEWSI